MFCPARVSRQCAASLIALSAPVAAQVNVAVTSDMELLVANKSQKSMQVQIEYEGRCAGTSQIRSGTSHVYVGANQSSRAVPFACAPTDESSTRWGVQSLRVLNTRWSLSAQQIELDNANAAWQDRKERERQWQQQLAQEEERRKQEKQRNRMTSCHIDANGRFQSDEVAYGKISRDCYTWFPELRTAAESVKQEEQRRRDAALKNMENARLEAAEHARIQHDRGLMQQRAAREQAELAESQRRMQEETARLDRERLLQAESEQRIRDDLARQERYKADPCGAVAEIRASQPDLKTLDPHATASLRSYTEQLNQQQVAAWNERLTRRARECQDLRDKPAREAAARAEAERRLQAQAQAKADYQRMVQETQASSRRIEREAKAMRDDNAELWRLIQGTKP